MSTIPLYVRVLPSKSAKLERRRAEKRLANTARRETGCKIDWDFRSDPRTVTAPPGRGVRSLFLRRNVGRQPPTSHPPHVRRRWDVRTPPNTPMWPGQGPPVGPAGPPSAPLLAAGGDFGVLKCECVDACRTSRCTYGFCRAVCEIRAPTSGEKVS